ncbi:jg20064 [Pararge aegeria aegeria]|uniref:Jg20064 protein n=1 Tax=Pararge aegeria aegeria TaxID=348720 RepID=A0A8S4SMR4_9NEOP|nr:jg20064 [Pararge aegeria aegeria]
MLNTAYRLSLSKVAKVIEVKPTTLLQFGGLCKTKLMLWRCGWWRRIEVTWTEFRTNISILQEIDIEKRLSALVQSRILKFFGHVSRLESDSIERLVVQGKVEGTRGRGRSLMRWTDQIKSAVGGPLHECDRLSASRKKWRMLVGRVTSALKDAS